MILKNVYAIMFGVADELKLGDNMRGHLMVAAIAELSGIVQSFGGQAHTPYSYAGLGDLLTTATSEDSHHHMLGRQLARGEWAGISGEGVHTLRMVEKFQVFDWRAYPLFSLSHDIVSAPATLHERLEEYLYAEEMGVDGIMLNEHHNAPFCMQARVNIFAAILAAMTQRVRKLLFLGSS